MPVHEPEASRRDGKDHAAPASDHKASASELKAPASAHAVDAVAEPLQAGNAKESTQVLSHWAETPKTGDEKNAATPASAPEPEPAASGGVGDLVLSRSATDSTEAALPRFRGLVKAKVEGWGLHFDPASVYLGTVKGAAAEQKAVLLKWSADWGSPPATHEVPPSMAPIEAHAAVTAVKHLKGWSKIDAGDQSILENLLGGEGNQLSASARRHLLGKFRALGTQTDSQQATALKGLITGQEALPAVVDEQVATTATKYTLSGPTEKKDYDFRGKRTTAEEWLAKYEDGTSLVIVTPKAQDPALINHSVKQAAESASYLPKAARAVVNTILLNAVTNPDDPHWAQEYDDPNFHSYMTAGTDGIVTVYPDKKDKAMPNDNYMRGTMIHETGHTWSYKTWGDDETQGGWVTWQAAMDQDKVSTSGYATNAIAEDVAETIQVFGSTQGTPRFDEYKKIVPHRFAILEKEYGK